jgi:hypothetical protein
MRDSVRKAILFSVLGGLVGLVVLDSREEVPGRSAPPDGADGGGIDASAEAAAPAAGAGRLELRQRPPLGEPRAALFGAPPPVKASAVVAGGPPPAPVAPPMPYRFAGRLLRDGQEEIFLSRGDSVISVRQGETIDGGYRVEAIGEEHITLIYLPLRKKETIPVFSTLPSVAAQGQALPLPETMQSGATAAPAADLAVRPAPEISRKTDPLAAARSASDGKTAQVLWVGPQKVRLGSRFEVALKVTSGEPLRAMPMQLRFNPSHLEFVTAKPGKFLGGGNRSFMYRASPDGSIFVGASSPNPAPAMDAELLVLTFKSVKPAQAELSFASLNLEGPAGRPIAFGRPEPFRTSIMP